MTIRFMDHAGEQIELTVNQFAEALSLGEVWGLCYSYYDHNHPLNGNVTGPFKKNYHQLTYKPKFTKLAKHLRSLPEVNSKFEFYVAWSPNWESDDFFDISFTRQGDTILVEIH